MFSSLPRVLVTRTPVWERSRLPALRPQAVAVRWWTLFTLAAVALGFAVSYRPVLAIAALGCLVVLVAVTIPTEWIIGVLVCSLFTTRLVVHVGGLGVRPEHFMAVALIAHACVRSERGAVLRAILRPAALWFGAFILWSALISWFQAPFATRSLVIVTWLASDWVILVALLALAPKPSDLVRHGAHFASTAAAVAITLWLLGVAGITTFGTQVVPGLNFRPAYGLSFEANILAGVLMVWAFIALTDQRILSPRQRWVTIALCLTAATLAYTRAAFVGFLIGSLLWRMQAGKRFRLPMGKVVAAIFGVLCLAVVFPQYSSALGARAGQLLDLGSGTGAQRVSASATALKDLRGMNLLLGLGTNSFGQRHLEPTLPDTPTPGYLANFPVQVVYDSGLIGSTLLLGAFLAVVPRKGANKRRAILIAVVYLVSAIATSPAWFASTWYLFAVGALLKNERSAAMPVSEGSAQLCVGGLRSP